jgi:hypothetical protein
MELLYNTKAPIKHDKYIDITYLNDLISPIQYIGLRCEYYNYVITRMILYFKFAWAFNYIDAHSTPYLLYLSVTYIPTHFIKTIPKYLLFLELDSIISPLKYLVYLIMSYDNTTEILLPETIMYTHLSIHIYIYNIYKGTFWKVKKI